MIALAEIIIRLREKCPLFQNRVGGTAMFAALTAKEQTTDLQVPNCFVIPMEERNITAEEKTYGDKAERRREYFSTVICVDNTLGDAIGGAGMMNFDALDQLRAIQSQIEDAFSGWVPKQKFDAIQFERGRHVTLNSKRMWHQLEWSTDYWINTALNDAAEEALEEQVREITGEGCFEGSPIDTIEFLVMGYEQDRWIDDPATVNTFLVQNPPIPEPSQETLAAAEAAADHIEDVDPLPLP